jgi:hypothetical protein
MLVLVPQNKCLTSFLMRLMVATNNKCSDSMKKDEPAKQRLSRDKNIKM